MSVDKTKFQISDPTISEGFKVIMLREINKFVSVYNSICLDKKLNGINISNYDYSDIIRAIGNYILKTFSLSNWTKTKMILNDDESLDMSLFEGTKYRNSVENYLISLEKAFYSNMDKEIKEYLETTTDFNETEKELCSNFFKHISTLARSMQYKNFSDTYNKVGSVDSIKAYNDELRNFHEFTLNTSSDQNKFVVIERFDVKMKEILKTRENVVVYFDDFTK
jgi:hypothetical protein